MEMSTQATPSNHLRQERKRRHWTQHNVAEQVDATVVTVRRWEQGRQQPGAHFLQKLCALFGQSAEELGLVASAPQPPTSASSTEGTMLWVVPYPRNPFFLGRDEELAHLRRHFHAGQTMALSQAQAISGLGGIGKTQLALQYAYRYAQDYQIILWARAESAEALVASYVAFAASLALPQREVQEQAVIVEAVKRWLGTHREWLLVLDNADDLAILPGFLPPLLGGHLLITTRAGATGRLAQRIEIEILSAEQGALLLLRRSGLLVPDAELSQALPEEQALAMQIAEELGGLPLALDQAGAYLEETGIGLAAYWQLYQQHRANLLQERRGGFIADHPASVAATWSLSFERVQEKNPAAAQLLYMAAFLSPDAIPEELFTDGASVLDPILAPVAANPLSFNQALEALRAYSLIRRNPARKVLSVHRLVQAVLQGTLEQAAQRDWAERVMLTVNAVFPRAAYATWLRCERLLSQARVAIQWIEHYQLTGEEAARLLFEMASYLQDRARYAEAEQFCQRALHIMERQLELEHPRVVHPLNGLASVYSQQGKYVEAESLYLRALSTWEQQVGPDHPQVARPLNGLASVYSQQSKYAEAEPLFQRALSIREQQLGPEHPHTAETLHDFAAFQEKKGNRQEAYTLYQQAFAIRERALGPAHPRTSATRERLTALREQAGQEADALPEGAKFLP